MSCIDFLIPRLPEQWETFKTTMQGHIRHLIEEQMIAYIQDEDSHLEARNISDVMYDVNAPLKRRVSTTKFINFKCRRRRGDLALHFCRNSGHEPPDYCPKCKTQGQNLQNFHVKGKKSSNLKGDVT